MPKQFFLEPIESINNPENGSVIAPSIPTQKPQFFLEPIPGNAPTTQEPVQEPLDIPQSPVDLFKNLLTPMFEQMESSDAPITSVPGVKEFTLEPLPEEPILEAPPFKRDPNVDDPFVAPPRTKPFSTTIKFDPEGNDFDYERALAAGMTRDETGHFGSVVNASDQEKKQFSLPNESYLVLKGKNHPTFQKAVEAEKQRGFQVKKFGERYFSIPESQNTGIPGNQNDKLPDLPDVDASLTQKIDQTATRNKIPANIFRSLVQRESSFRVDVPDGKDGEIGLVQIKPKTFKEVFPNGNPRNIDDNIEAGARYFGKHFRNFKNKGYEEQEALKFAAASYNGGPGNVHKALRRAQRISKNKTPDFNTVSEFIDPRAREYALNISGAVTDNRSREERFGVIRADNDPTVSEFVEAAGNKTLSGIVQVPKTALDLFDMVGNLLLGDDYRKTTLGEASTNLQKNFFGKSQDILSENLPENFVRKIRENDGFLPNFEEIFGAFFEFLPQLPGMFTVGKGGQNIAKAFGLGEKASARIGAVLTGTGFSSTQVYSETLDDARHTLSQMKNADGVSRFSEDQIESIAQRTAFYATSINALPTAILSAMGLSKALMTKGNIFKRAFDGALADFFPEALQESIEGASQDFAIHQNVDPSRNVITGDALKRRTREAGVGGALGATTGGGFGAFNTETEVNPEPEREEEPDATITLRKSLPPQNIPPVEEFPSEVLGKEQVRPDIQPRPVKELNIQTQEPVEQVRTQNRRFEDDVEPSEPINVEVPNRKPVPLVEGRKTELKTVSGAKPVSYSIVEMKDLLTSHNPETFQPTPEYPSGVQERQYHQDKQAQARVIEQTKDFDPKFVLTNDPTPSNGPPIITKTGVVLGGNSRAMTLNRLFREGRQEEYLRALRENAENFGIDSNSIEDFDSPILVRKVQDAPSDVESLRALGSDLNRGFTAELSSFEKAVSSGKRVSQETVDVISEKLDESGDNATLRQLFSKESALILNRLVKDGVISQRELPQFIDQKRNLLTEAGKDFIEKALLGSVIDDPVILSNTPANVRNKITVSLASLSKIKSRGGDWDILADLMKATEATIEATAKGMTGDQFLSQSDLFDDGRLSDRSADLFRALMHDKPNLWKKKLSRYAAEAQADIDGQSSFFEKKTPEETFDEIFGRLETGVDAIKIPGLPRIAKTFNQAKEAVKKFLNKGIKNTETGLVASVSNESLRKILSNSSVSRSVSPEAHSLATANIDHLFKIAKRTESRGDKRGDINIKSIQRFSAPMQFKGETLQAKILVKEFASEEQGARIYNVEAIQIEKPSRRPASEEGIEPEDLDPPGREGSFNTNVDQEPGNVKRANNDPDTDKNQGDNDSLRAASFQVELQKEPTTDQTINKQEILDLVEATFGMVVRGKATHAMRDAAGWRERHSELIRLKKGRFAHVEVLAHEIAHGIDAEIERAWPNRFKTNQQLINSRVDSWKVQSLPKEIRKKAILELKDLDYDQEKRRTHEGFAEFMRHFLTTGKHEELAPTYSKWFQETFLKQAMVNDAGKMFLPAPKEAVKSFSLVKKTDAIEKPKGFRPISGKFGALKKALEIWYAQGSVNRMRAQIDFTGKLQNSEETASRKAYKTIIKEFYDSNFLFEEVTQAVEKKTGKKIPPNRDPFELATFYKGKVASIAETMIRKTMVDPMGNRVGPSLVEAIKPAKLNTKKKMEDWITYVVALKAKNNTRRGLETGFDIVDIDNVIKEFEGNEGWLEAAKGVTEWSNQLMDWYVWSGDISPELKNLFRDLNPIYMPFSRIFRESLQVGTGGGGNFEQKARAIKKQKGSTRPIKNPMDAFIESAAAIVSRSIKTRIANSLADFSREKGVGGIITEIPSALHVKKFKAEKIMDQLAEMGVDISELDPEEVLNLWYRDANFYGKDNVFAVWRRGELKLFEVHPELYQAIKETDTHRINSIVFRAFAGVARLMRLGFTGLNFGFSFFTNPIRDFVWSAVTTKKKFSTPLAPFRGLVKEWTAPKGSITDKALNSGLQMATMMGFDRKATTAMYDDLVTQQLSPFEKTLKVASSPTLLLDKIRQAFQVAELAPRVVELETYERIQKENPNWSPDAVFIKAFNNAQDVTVNFTKSGRTGKFINQYTAFHNVSWQGPNKLFRAFKEAPIRTLWFGFLWVTLPAMIAWDLEKDKEWYKNIPPEWKYMNMWIEDESTGKVIRVPGAHELYLLLGGLPVAGLDQEHLKDPKAVKGTLEAIKKLLVAPLDVTPSALKPLLEVGTNSNWLGHPIEPEWMRDNKTGLPVEDRKFFFTPELSEIAAKTINQFSDTKVSPIQMDHILRQMTGGLYQKGLGILDTERESHKHPLNPMAVLKFKNRPTRQLNDFFTLRTDLQQKKNAKKANSKEIGKLKLMERFYKGQIRPLQTKIREQQKLKTLKSIEAIDRMYGVMADRFNRFNKNILSKEK